MYSYFNTSNRFNFHALRRDETGMLVYTKTNTSDSDVIDVYNVDGTQQVDFMDAWNNVVEVGAVKSVSHISGGIPVPDDANTVYTVTGLVGNGDGDGEANQRPGEGLNLIINRNAAGLIDSANIDLGNDVTDLVIKVDEVVKSFSNDENNDKYQQYKFEARKITYFIDDEGYFVARFGTFNYTEGPNMPK